VPAGLGGRRSHDGAVWVDHCVVVVDDANDVHRVFMGVLDVHAGLVAFGLVVEPGYERSGTERRLVGEAEIVSHESQVAISVKSWELLNRVG